ncbi:hypothetical protein C8R43DRAFT_950578 [Mycena crocata]|nr:hypothetical protein C8R43DRAFT_950578 [Mycena crocata]
MEIAYQRRVELFDLRTTELTKHRFSKRIMRLAAESDCHSGDDYPALGSHEYMIHKKESRTIKRHRGYKSHQRKKGRKLPLKRASEDFLARVHRKRILEDSGGEEQSNFITSAWTAVSSRVVDEKRGEDDPPLPRTILSSFLDGPLLFLRQSAACPWAEEEMGYHRKTDGKTTTQQREERALPTPIHRRPRVHPFVRDDDGDDYVCLNVPVDLLQQWDAGLLSFTDLEAHISVKFGQTNDISRRVGEYRHCSDNYEAIGWVGYFRVRHRKTVDAERRVHDALYALGIAPTQEICACLTVHREFFPLSAIAGGFNRFLAIIRRVLVAAGETDLNL